ncbi:hypothetical protein ABR737_01470 [Streptomyces sp. Edi2]|uniref:hypothetical protein n=1 Tax=Streptomyces sp. Edi2 TaxID=3162528 RepID=UPI003305CC9D
MSMELLSVDERVDNGVRFLDHYGPCGWRGRIDTTVLDIDSGLSCVVGQLYDDWEFGQAELGLRDWTDDAIFYGLYPVQDGEAEALTASWRAVLLGARAPSLLPRVAEESDVLHWQCGWQTAYGMPWEEYCAAPKAVGDDYCPEHERDLAETYPHLRRSARAA